MRMELLQCDPQHENNLPIKGNLILCLYELMITRWFVKRKIWTAPNIAFGGGFEVVVGMMPRMGNWVSIQSKIVSFLWTFAGFDEKQSKYETESSSYCGWLRDVWQTCQSNSDNIDSLFGCVINRFAMFLLHSSTSSECPGEFYFITVCSHLIYPDRLKMIDEAVVYINYVCAYFSIHVEW